MKKLWLFFTVLFMVFTGLSQTMTSSIDSLNRLCEKADEIQKIGLYLQLSFLSRNDTSKSNAYAQAAYQLASKNHLIPDQVKAIYYLGETAYDSRNFDLAVLRYQQAIPLFAQLSDTFMLTNCSNAIGLSYHEMFKFEKAIANYIEGLKLAENDQEFTAELLSNIASSHAKMNNHPDAISNYRKALRINTSIKDSSSMAVNYNGLGATFSHMNRHDSTIFYFQKAHDLFKKLKNPGYQAIALSNIAAIFPNYPDSLEKAIDYFNQASIIFKHLGWNHYQADILHGMGNVFCKQGKFKESLEAYTESLRLTDLFNCGIELKKSNYGGLSELYEKMGDYKTALKYHVLFTQYSDSLVQKEKYEQLANLEKQYEIKKKENEIIRLHTKQELMDIQLKKNKQLKQLGYITATILLFYMLLVLLKYIDKIKLNQLLEEKNHKIEQSEQELRLLNASKNKFFSIIAHDLKNPFHSVMGYSHLLSTDYSNFTEKERRKFASDIHQSTNTIFRLLQNLLDWSGSQTGKLIVTPMETEYNRILDNSVSVLHTLAQQKKIKLNYPYSEGLMIYADPQMIETVLRNLINNAIKFTPENGTVHITAQQTGTEVTITVTDTGVGISDEDVRNLFRIDSKVKRKGTNDEDGSGLGLILCYEFIIKNNGTIQVESKPGKGSSFIVRIPAKTMN
jgi:signal transduction histidine kinase